MKAKTELIVFFMIPGSLMFVGFWFVFPFLMDQGFPEFWGLFLSLWLPLIALFSFLVIRQVGRGQKPSDLFRIGRLNSKQWFLVVFVFLLVTALEGLLDPTRDMIFSLFTEERVSGLPLLFLPGYAIDIPMLTFMGQSVPGNYALLLMWTLWLAVNVGFEELLWRGYALPRMELVFGRFAWLVNGLLWNIVIHAFMPWAWITLLPVSLAVPYFCQRYQSIWPGVVIHGSGNALLLVLIAYSVVA